MSDPREVIAAELAEFNDGRVAGQDERDDAEAILSALSEAGYVVVPQAEIERLKAGWDAASLCAIEASNPGIDMEDVKRVRARLAAGTTTPRKGDER